MKTSTVQRKHVIQPKQKYNHLYFAVILLIIVSVIIAICVLTFNSIEQEMENNSSKNYEMMQVDDQQNKPKGAEIGSNTGEDTRLVKSNSDNSTKPNRHVCYLTFDDGPSANTERILSILDKYNIKATWFVKADNQDLSKVKKIWDEGNQVAVHTFTHDYNQIYASTNAFWNDYNLAYTALDKL